MALNSGGFVKQALFNQINMVTYLVATLVWIGYSLSPLAVRPASRQPATDPAVGAKLGRSSAPRRFGFADSDVRRDGGARVFQKL